MDMTDFSLSPEAPALVIGAAGVDVVGRMRGELHPGTSNPAQIRTSFGGVARNVAENLARLGQPVKLISVVGDDQIGDQLIERLVSTRVNVDGVIRTDKFFTGAYLAVVNASGEMQFGLDDMRATNLLVPEHIREREDLFKNASILFLDANIPKDTLRTILSLARRYHLPVCSDPTSAVLAQRLRPHLSRLSLITPNCAEAGILCDEPFNSSRRREALQAAKCLVGQGVQIVIITMAEFGVVYATSETSGYIPSMRTTIVDPTGAGDALTATVLFALLNDIPLDDAIRLGVSAASLTLRYRGTVVPDLSLEKLYDQLI